MRKWNILIIMFCLMFCLVNAADICEKKINPGVSCQMLTPTLTCLNYNYTIYNTSESIENGSLTNLEDGIYYFIFNQSSGSYIVQLCDLSTREIIVEGESKMASLSITLFILCISLGLFLLGFFKKTWIVKKDKISEEIVNLIIKRSIFVLATFLMVMNSAIMAEIAVVGGLNLKNEMFMYMIIFGWGGYALMVYLVIQTLIDTLRGIRKRHEKERVGEIDD